MGWSRNSYQPLYNIFGHNTLRPAGYPSLRFYLPDSKYYPLSSSADDKRSKNSVTAECFRKIDAGQAMLIGHAAGATTQIYTHPNEDLASDYLNRL